MGSALARPLTAFVAAALLIHALLGVFAFALARLTESAFPDRRVARRGMLIAGWFSLLAGLVMAANTTWFVSSIFSGEDSWWRGLVLGAYPVQIFAALFSVAIIALAWKAAPALRRAWPVPVAIGAMTILASLAALGLPRSAAVHPGGRGCAPRGVDRHRLAAKRPHGAPARCNADSPRSRLPRGRATLQRRDQSPRPHVRSLDVDPDGPAPGIHQRARQPDAPPARSRRRHARGRTPPSWLSRHLRHGRGPLRQLRRELRIRSTHHAASRGDRFRLGLCRRHAARQSRSFDRAGGWLFPSNHANRAANVTYQPRHFVERLDDEITIEGPSSSRST